MNRRLRSCAASSSCSIFSSSCLNVEHLEQRILLSTVQIFAAGDSGEEEMQLFVDGEFAQSFQNVGGDSESNEFVELIYETDQTLSDSQITIKFVNDFYDPDNGIDRNLQVDRIVIDGATFDADADQVYSTGGYEGENQVSGFGLGKKLYSNGRLDFGSDSAAATSLTVYALGTTGEERFEVIVNDQIISAFATAQQSGMTAYDVALNETITPNDVRIRFANDLYLPELDFDRNLIVDRIVVDGISYQSESPSVFSTGTYVIGQGNVDGFWQTEFLHSNGYFQYSDSDIDLTPPTVTLDFAEDVFEPGVSDVQLGILLRDNIGIDFPPSSVDALTIIGPNGEQLTPQETFGTVNDDGSLFVGYFLRNFGPFTQADNGVYEIYVNENTIFDRAGNAAAPGLLGTFTIEVTTDPGDDLEPPVARIAQVVTNEPGNFQVVIEFEDNIAMGSIGENAITLFGPNFYEEFGIQDGGGGIGNAFRTVTYRFASPGDSWGPEDNGQYNIFLNDGTVFDLAGNFAVAEDLGTFDLNF